VRESEGTVEQELPRYSLHAMLVIEFNLMAYNTRGGLRAPQKRGVFFLTAVQHRQPERGREYRIACTRYDSKRV
jgi:hypothetical protein